MGWRGQWQLPRRTRRVSGGRGRPGGLALRVGDDGALHIQPGGRSATDNPLVPVFLPAKWAPGVVETNTWLAQARCAIVASFGPRWLAPPREAILKFDFEHACIVLPAVPVPREQEAAEALREYFRFASVEIEHRKKPLLLEI
jgi:hypothetical protein